VYSRVVRARAAELLAGGLSLNATSKRLGVSRATLREWRDNPAQADNRPTDCPRCNRSVALDTWAYSHLLGLYLGDGCISSGRKQVYSLRITCDQRYPRLIAETRGSLAAVRPGAKTYLVATVGCVNVLGYWKHWPCLFPQHGPGRKHQRPIVLADWQREIVVRHPERFVRGLFHSDGCRITNWTVRTVAGRPKRYEYPRYLFSNESADIVGLCTWALDLLGVAWRLPRHNMVSVARREAVAVLDTHVGPKT
jgi:hypothetical protein